MAERRLIEYPRRAGISRTAGTLPLKTHQWCTHWPIMKCFLAQGYLWWSVNCPCMIVFALENSCNKGPTQTPLPDGRMWYPTALRPTANMNQNIEEDHEAAQILWQVTLPPVFFRPYVPEFSPNVLADRDERPTLPARAETAHAAQALTKTDAHKNASSEASRNSKINSYRAQPIKGQNTAPRSTADPESDVMLADSFGGKTATLNMLSQTKTCPWSWTSCQTLRDISEYWERCTRSC